MTPFALHPLLFSKLYAVCCMLCDAWIDIAAANCRSWELNAPWSGAQVKVPAKFIIGELDLTYHVPGTKDHIHKGGFQKLVPLLQEVVVLEGAAHFVNQERADEINEHIYAFLKQF
ncbi:UNVERIFIED_CONTAM: hypothetical protein Sradi_2763400 [Sesamum radiatum]|uniref:Epoxide hydrolase n=1 Tax=Sesamum radiatum TaxID=300843 RepID=A0AAW2SAT2_SESRA